MNFNGPDDILKNITGIIKDPQIKSLMPKVDFDFEWNVSTFDSLGKVCDFVNNRGMSIFQLFVLKENNEWCVFYSKKVSK